MRSSPGNHRIRLVKLAVIIFGLFSLPVSRAAAEISQAGGSIPKADTAHGFQIHFIEPHVSKLCVGQKTILEAEYGPDSFLTPLIDVSSITFWTSNGNSFSQETLSICQGGGSEQHLYGKKRGYGYVKC